ncbi:ricin-type beta-trefoil lectin protein [Kribbella amoyensis]|uniref:Ricin-type beta-trefoil lectin protein n=1 Tax=Kribbella amoyensis TaxID=996641 RepID=A0A561B7R9_9ACTN|nr:chitinase [Kribbella amoyensis]TWD74883.1 ricin-type beta-trefoil lectin protein [Kribbella amoyensis]
MRARVLATVAVVALGAGLLVAPPAAQAVEATGTITGLAGKCVDVAAANSADGTAVQLYDCNGSNAQNWTRSSDGTVKALGKCLDVSGGSVANGAKVQLWTCNGSAAQQWTYTSGRDLVNPQADKCLDVTGNRSTNATPLQLWSCTGAANQKWTAPALPGNPPPAGAAPMAAAPYLYQGWGSPPNPATVMNATGVKWFTMAFILSNGYCNPMWDGSRPLTGGVDQQAVNAIRANGGDVVVSVGGWSGNKLGENCNSAGELAGAYQKVINALSLKAIDVDIEASEFSNPTTRQRVIDALKIVEQNNPGIATYLTFGTSTTGPDGDGQDLIRRGAASGLNLDGWVIMPFNFGGGTTNMATLTRQAADGLKNRVRDAYGLSDDAAYRKIGISSMNGITDVAGERVNLADFESMLSYASQHHLARFTFWSVNRDRPCNAGGADTCSGVPQQNWEFTKVIGRYRG